MRWTSPSTLREHGKRAGWAEAFVFTNASNTAAMALYRSAGGIRPNPDGVCSTVRLYCGIRSTLFV
jgi:hypothetical protein